MEGIDLRDGRRETMDLAAELWYNGVRGREVNGLVLDLSKPEIKDVVAGV